MIDLAGKTLCLFVSRLVYLKRKHPIVETELCAALWVCRMLEGEHIVFAVFIGVAESARLRSFLRHEGDAGILLDAAANMELVAVVIPHVAAVGEIAELAMPFPPAFVVADIRRFVICRTFFAGGRVAFDLIADLLFELNAPFK